MAKISYSLNYEHGEPIFVFAADIFTEIVHALLGTSNPQRYCGLGFKQTFFMETHIIFLVF